MTESLLGKPASEALLAARGIRNERIRADIRPKALEAAEVRLKAEKAKEEGGIQQYFPEPKKRSIRLLPAWEEQ